jgi:hypothetical protein
MTIPGSIATSLLRPRISRVLRIFSAEMAFSACPATGKRVDIDSIYGILKARVACRPRVMIVGRQGVRLGSLARYLFGGDR